MDKKYLLRILSYVALALAAIVLIADVGIQLVGSMRDEVETTATQLIETGDRISARGYVLRTEYLLEVPTNGYLDYTVENGERVSNGSEIACVYADTEENRRLLEAIERIDRRLELLAEANSIKGVHSVASADNRIAALRQAIDAESAEGHPVSSELEEELLVMLYVRDMRSGRDYKEMKEPLEKERVELASQLGTLGKTVTADRLGYFYARCDGYENYFDPTSLMSASVDDFAPLFEDDPRPTFSEDAVGKIVTDYNWYLICSLPLAEARGMSESANYTITFDGDNNRTLTMKLTRLVREYGNDECVLIFSYSEVPEDFAFTRFQTVSIERETFNGYKVPVSAVRSLDGIAGVYILRGSIVEFREIRPVSVQDGIVTVDANAEATGEYKMLQYYDRIIVRGKELYVGKIID